MADVIESSSPEKDMVTSPPVGLSYADQARKAAASASGSNSSTAVPGSAHPPMPPLTETTMATTTTTTMIPMPPHASRHALHAATATHINPKPAPSSSNSNSNYSPGPWQTRPAPAPAPTGTAIPSLSDQDGWPEVSKASMSQQTSRSALADEAMTKKEKTKWVAIPPAELQAAADAEQSKARRGSANTSSHSSPRHSGRHKRLAPPSPTSASRFLPPAYAHHNHAHHQLHPLQHTYPVYPDPGPLLVLASQPIHHPHQYQHQQHQQQQHLPGPSSSSIDSPPSPPRSPPRITHHRRRTNPAKAPALLAYRDLNYNPELVHFGDLSLDDSALSSTQHTHSSPPRRRRPLGIGISDDPTAKAAGSRAGGKRKQKHQHQNPFDVWTDNASSACPWRFGSTSQPDIAPSFTSTPAWDGALVHAPPPMPILFHPGVPYMGWAPPPPPPLLADDPFIVNAGRGSRRPFTPPSGTSFLVAGQYDRYSAGPTRNGDSGYGLRSRSDRRGGRGGRGYNGSRYHSGTRTPLGYNDYAHDTLSDDSSAVSSSVATYYSPRYAKFDSPAQHSKPPPPPVTTLSFSIDSTRWHLLGQLEYYFSTQNLATDLFLRQQMDSKGWIPIATIAAFPRIQHFTTDFLLLRDTLSLSSLLETWGPYVRLRGRPPVEEGQEALVAMTGWEAFVLPDAKESRVEEEMMERPENIMPHYYPGMPMMYSPYIEYPPPSGGYAAVSPTSVYPAHTGFLALPAAFPPPPGHPYLPLQTPWPPGPHSHPHSHPYSGHHHVAQHQPPFDNLSPPHLQPPSRPEPATQPQGGDDSFADEDDDDIVFVTAPPERRFSPRALTPVRMSHAAE